MLILSSHSDGKALIMLVLTLKMPTMLHSLTLKWEKIAFEAFTFGGKHILDLMIGMHAKEKPILSQGSMPFLEKYM